MNDSMLFVDDDPNLLQGLQRMLRSKREEWDMTFVAGPRQALAEMEKRCFDVVVVDMRMPEIDGAELLARVKRTCPRSVRIILSGQADLPTIIKSVESTHQYLSKPCDPDTLRATIQRATTLRSFIQNEEIEERISQLRSLPSQPDIYDAVLKELSADEPADDRLATLIGRDLGMSLKVLQLTNSSFFGPKQEVRELSRAVAILGIDILRKLFISYPVFTRCDTGKVGALDIAENNAQAISPSGILAPTSEGRRRFACGVGRLLLAQFFTGSSGQLARCDEVDEAVLKKEAETFHVNRLRAGSYLIGLWGLPDAFIDDNWM